MGEEAAWMKYQTYWSEQWIDGLKLMGWGQGDCTCIL